MNASDLNRYGELQQVVRTKAASNQMVETPVKVADCWAKVEVLTGREYFDAAQVLEETPARITIRYRAGVTSEWRWVDHGTGEIWEFRSNPADLEMRHEWLEIVAVKRQPTAA